jgi:hypothetical protein
VKALLIRLALFLGVAFAAYLALFHYTDLHQVAIARNWITGEMWLDDTPGPDLTLPWVKVARIDKRPMRVCITSAARAYNCKLVQFDPSAYKEFAATQGFGYYWLANRISINFGYDEEYRGVKDILRGYAFSGKEYPFLRVLREYQGSELPES